VQMPQFSLELLKAKLGPREKMWIVVWAVIVLALLQIKGFIVPRAQAIQDQAEEIYTLEEDKISTLAKQPNVQEQQGRIDDVKQSISDLYDQLVLAEKDLLDFQDVDRLLESLVKDRRKFAMQLNSIRPIKQKETSLVSSKQKALEPYRKLNVQLDLFSTFQGLLDYIDFLEQMRPYQKVDGAQVKVEGKDVSRPHAVLLLSVLMGDTLEQQETQREEVLALLGDEERREKKDPFLTSERPKEMVQAVGLVLTGVFSEEGRPVAAMINNEIYRVGQVVQGKRIIGIEDNRVYLEQGNRRFVLLPSKGGSQ